MPTHPGKRQGEPIRTVEDLPEEFAEFSDEAKQAAMDAYNGALADGEPISTAFAMAQQAAQSVDQSQQQGVSPETGVTAEQPAERPPAAAQGPASLGGQPSRGAGGATAGASPLALALRS